MSVESKTPDLVRRAAARLNEAASPRKPIEQLIESAPSRARDIPPLDAVSTRKPVEVLSEAPLTKTKDIPSHAAPSGVAARVDRTSDAPQSRIVSISPTTLAGNSILLPSAGYTRTVEEFRIIKRQVLANIARNGAGAESDMNRVLMVTSAQPGDGKTYTSINLALSIAAERDHKVLLVDADVYRQSMTGYLGIKADTGWLDLLSDNPLPFSDVLLHTNIPNLSVLPAGKPHPEVPELMSSRKMTQLVHEMSKRYPDRFIIFDSLPCMASSEPAILAGVVGQAIFVVAAHQTLREELEASLRLISACPNVSLVLNKAAPLLTEQFGKYKYEYGYRH